MSHLIAIVEDDADLAGVLATVLESHGYAVSSASNGREALEQLHAGNRPALILLDMMMPIMDGREFREAQAGDAEIAGIPVVLMTADGNAPRKAESIGAVGYLAKPVGIPELLGEVRRVLGA
jgi:two-component system, chemotaxis family, chemotaxis protein CheY